MPPRLRPRPLLGPGQSLFTAQVRLARPAATRSSQACLFCSLQQRAACKPQAAHARLASRQQSIARRGASTATAVSAAEAAGPVPAVEEAPIEPLSTRTSAQIRADLADTLGALQQEAGALLNISRLQLAIRSLQQPAGQESVRVAILGLTGVASTSPVQGGRSAKQLLRLVLADPLQDEQAWEAQLADHDPKKPLIVRVRGAAEGVNGSAATAAASTLNVRFDKDEGLTEMEVSSPVLNGNQLEFLVMESSLAVPTPPASATSDPLEGTTETFEETVLVPEVEIHTSQDGLRFTPVTTPVHQALVVADGLLGAAAVANLPLSAYPDEMKGAVNLRLPVPEAAATNTTSLPFTTFDIATSSEAIALFRASVANAKAYETLWVRGGVSALSRWLHDGAVHRPDGTTKPPVRQLVASVLRNALASIQTAEAKLVSASTTSQSEVPVARAFASLDTGLADWAESAHAELQTQLDLAFSGRRWRKLGWWKLFWRADDVTMLSSGLVTQQFLPQAEQDVVFLAGRIDEAVWLSGLRTSETKGSSGAIGQYPIPVVAVEPTENTAGAVELLASPAGPRTPWPTHIAFTRRYLLDETVPALQALAQRLVLQTAGTSGLATALAVLTYLSSSGAYEAGAIAAVGLVWSLGRMQKKWEAARAFWEGEVREEGRKAVRAVEASVATALDEARDAAVSGGQGGADRRQQLNDLRKARALVEKAKEELAQLK
ncbi:uncharacterized protein SPSK_06030 [Sporothrix schenckii 1099-18]|uniref:Mmc1 C-terminal domain-containing protein n=2 Tax=Sporothrix schenckii TaxID=29908 RepID=U7PKU8_SPOS1|nr:uncharacterized protein SPSK_06030 [Sporothrix schenckii 1099-18]ERS95145.1 hypothetical protein HMPREF1624_08355 [Sporothrix schenckii ATCC 58251]KJR89933.1 hypothetical protein SPSK_06030 [Sporothrix schenckii 1099-18]